MTSTCCPHLKRKETAGSMWDLRCPCSRHKGQHVGFMLPPIEIEGNRGDMWHLCSHSKQKETRMCGKHATPVRKERKWGMMCEMHATPVRNGRKRGTTCGMHAAPIQNERKQRAACGIHAAPICTPAVSLTLLVLPSYVSWLLFPLLAPPHPPIDSGTYILQGGERQPE